MSYQFKIAIPTYDRYDNFKTIIYLEKNNVPKELIYIFVSDEEQLELYKSRIGEEYNFIIGILGLVEQRNFITNYFDEGEIIISMDDDIEDLIHKDDKPFMEWTQECIEYLYNSNYSLLSINPSINPYFFEQRKTCKKHIREGNYYCVGAFYILKNDKNIILDKNILLEDCERSLLYNTKYGKNIIYKNILIKTKYFGEGGLSHERTKYNYLSSINKLIYRYPERLSFNYKSLPLDKNILFPNLRFNKQIKTDINVIELPEINASELFELYSMLENIIFPKKTESTNRRGFPIGHQALTFGYTRARFVSRKNGKLFDLSNCSLKYPEIYNELLRIGNIYCPFDFTSIHVNRNVVCPKHKDSRNIGKSMLLSFGDYTGCNIIINEKKYDANCRPLIFDGANFEHYNSDDLQGTKYSLVYYNGAHSNQAHIKNTDTDTTNIDPHTATELPTNKN